MNDQMNTAQRLDEAAVILRTRSYVEDGQELISVPLTGKRGKGRHMTLDASVWRAGRAAGWPAAWIIFREQRSNRDYVITTRAPVARTDKPVPLARLITGAAPGEFVVFQNGDTLDLRQSNLVKLSREEFLKRLWTTSQWKTYIEVEDAGDEVPF